MIETNYDYNSGYHEGTLVEQDALAFLGVFKRIEDVPQRYYLGNFETEVSAEDAWEAFLNEEGPTSEHSRKYVYGKAWRTWNEYCEDNGLHPALPDPEDLEEYLSEQREKVPKLKSVHDARFRPLFRWFRWMQFHVDYLHRYNPLVMAVLEGGTVYDVWKTRFADRKNNPEEK